MVGTLFLGLLLQLSFSWSAQGQSPEITADELRAHVKYLASDELEGRGSGTEGNRKAAEYIAKYFKQYGLKPAGDNGTYFQKFEFVSALKLGVNNALSFDGVAGKKLTVDEDFRPLGFSMNATITAPLVFAGYGISAPDQNYDDFKDIDVTGKAVVVLRYGPDGDDPHSTLATHTTFRNKARTARDKGAVALLIVTGPADSEDDDLVKLSFDNAFASSGIATISVKRSAINGVFKSAGRDLKMLQDSIKAKKKPVVFEFPGMSIQLATDVVKVMDTTANVLGYFESSGSEFSNEVVVVGAHMDHLGYGGSGTGSLTPDAHEIHNGADDNASGTAAILEVAGKFSESQADRRSILFAAFSGEELGTLGSAHYVNHPVFPLENTVAMFNFDMVGRLENRTLTVYGTGTSPEWPELLHRYNTDSLFVLKEVPDGFGPSDHMQFYSKDIPVLFFFSGTHSDYHKPSDDWEKLNYEGEEQIVRYAYGLISEVASKKGRPSFSRTASSTMTPRGDSRGFSVTLGVIPDYGETSEGMKIGGTRPNGPADKAGLKSGDVIVKMAGKNVLNIYDYMGILGELKSGDEVEVQVVRDGKPLKFTATMTKRE